MGKFVNNTLKSGGFLLNGINIITENNFFVYIICLLLAFYSARVSQDYPLPLSLYPFAENLFLKIIIFMLIIICTHLSKPIAIMLILSYTLSLISYYKQKGIENFEDMVTDFTRINNGKHKEI